MAPDTLLIKLPMGTGKMKALVEYLNSDQVPKDTRVIIISFHKSFTSELHKNIGPEFVDYQTIEGLIDANKVIVQYKSLGWLKIRDLDKTILILDEAKLTVTQTESLQMNNGDNIFGHWIIFDDLIKHLAKVIAMNANTGFRTYDLLATSCKHVCMINNLWHPSPEEAPIDMYYDKPESFFAAIVATTTKAKNVPFVVMSTSRTQAEVIHKDCLGACPDPVIKKYNSNSLAADRRDFDDVNKAWANVYILIYTSTISAGCSFELLHFTRVFGYFSSMSTDYKMAVQMLGCVRNISTREYHIFISSRSHDLPIHKSIVDKFRALNSCNDPLVLQLFSINGRIDFQHKDLFHQTHVNNIVHLNRSRSFYSMLFKRSCWEMGIVIKKPTPIELPKDLKHTIAKDRKEVAAIDDAQAKSV